MAARIVIWAGQSNSQGAAAMSGLQAQYKQTYSNVKVWTGASFASLNYLVNNNQYPTTPNTFGSEFALLSGLQSYWGETVYGINYSVSGSGLGTAQNASSNWNVNTRSSYYDALISTINSALAYLWITLNERFDCHFYIIWQQGEQDSKNTTDAGNYQANETALINAIRANISGSAYTYSRKAWINPLIDTLIVSPQNSVTTISGATNASPIVITTTGNHGLTTGMQVIIYGVGGNTAANGTWTVTYVSNTTFSLNTSTGNGVYTSGGFINQFVYPATVQTAQIAAAAGLSDCHTLNTDSYSLADGVHFDATGYNNKGIDEVTLITAL